MHSLRTFFHVHVPTVRAKCPNSESEKNSSANCSKFAVECDRNSKISQTSTKVEFIRKTNLIFLEIDEGGKFALECI